MDFDIREDFFDEDGEYDEDKFEDYKSRLMELFAESTEGKAILEKGTDIGWAYSLMNYAVSYFGVTPVTMTPLQMDDVVFDIFPRKISTEPEAGPEIVRELRAFWQFLDRVFKLENAKACLKILDEEAEERLLDEMGNPDNYGLAKSFAMAGHDLGLDLSSEEGLQELMNTANAEIALQNQSRDLIESPTHKSERQKSKSVSAKKAKRKMQRKSRKRNRKKR